MIHTGVSTETGVTRPAGRLSLRPGDIAAGRSDSYPILYEVIRIESDGLVRVRGLNWAPGYSALVDAEELRPVSSLAPAGRPDY